MKTLNGYPVSELTTILDQPLPRTAYKKIPAGALNLTDIDAGWQRRAFNKVFGLYGIGWGFDFNREDMDLRHEANKNDKILPFVRVYGHFWYAYIKDGQVCRAVFPVTGANSSQSGNEAYALKGAITNAIGFGASMIGWQESVYLGARSHDNTEGFAEGKDWTDITPEDVAAKEQSPAEPAPTPAQITPNNWHSKMAEAAKDSSMNPEPTQPPPVAKIVVYYCKDCKRILSGTCKPKVCQCGSTKLEDAADTDAARRAVNKLIDQTQPKKPVAPATPAESMEPQPTPAADTDKSLAEKLGFEPIKHAVCVHCGYAEPVNALPESCPKCGVANPWSVAPSHKAMVDMAANIKAKLELAKTADDSKTVLDEIKAVCKNDRRSILSALSEAAGKSIKNYSECDLDTMRKCLAQLKSGASSAGASNKPAPEAEPSGKSELCKAIYGLARGLNLGTPGQVIAEIGKVAGKPISTAAQLNEAELLDVYRNFKERSV
jgi:hypothetical protein